MEEAFLSVNIPIPPFHQVYRPGYFLIASLADRPQVYRPVGPSERCTADLHPNAQEEAGTIAVSGFSPGEEEQDMFVEFQSKWSAWSLPPFA